MKSLSIAQTETDHRAELVHQAVSYYQTKLANHPIRPFCEKGLFVPEPRRGFRENSICRQHALGGHAVSGTRPSEQPEAIGSYPQEHSL